MNTFWKHRGLAVLAVLTVGAPEVLAQRRPQQPAIISPFFRVPNNFRAATNFNSLLGQAYGAGNPFNTFGVNPYSTPSPFGLASPAGLPYSPFGAAPFAAATSPFAATAALNQASLLNSPYAAGATTAGLFSNPYGAYGADGLGGYGGYGYYESPLGGYLRGAADILNSEGRLGIQVQQAKLIREQVYRERLENHRRYIEEWKYWRDSLPTAEDDRQKALQLQVRRSLNDPPVGEIYSGQALNTILNDVQKKATKDSDFQSAPTISLDPDTVRHLNLTGQEGKGNPGLLRNEGRLNWPIALRVPQYQAERDVLNELTPAVYDQAVNGKVDASSLERMTKAVRDLRERLNDNIRDLTPTEYSEARRFLGDFEDALALLRQPGAGDYFGAKAPKAKTIGDLVQFMLSKGLRFAPAVPGDEPAYVAAHRALAAYDTSLGSQVVSDRPEKEK
jgi:hypothetical protein